MLKDEHKLPVDVRGSKTSVLKLSIDRLNTSASLHRIAPCLKNEVYMSGLFVVAVSVD